MLQLLEAALPAGRVAFGHEQCSENRGWLRAVLQFNIGAELLDWFFNSHSGYRAYLEMKGAFATNSGLYQPKSATVRAKALRDTGEPGYMQKQNADA